MKVALAGPSGSGKTTLANFISETFNLKFIPNSAGLVIPEEFKKGWRERYGWTEDGHANVIQLSHKEPMFGYEFQTALLHVRGHLIIHNNDFVIDRSPIDNVSYFLMQCSSYHKESTCQDFILSAQEYFRELTHMIIINTFGQEDVEDNGSRVANLYFQKMADAVFNHTHENYFYCTPVKVLRLATRDLNERKALVKNFLG